MYISRKIDKYLLDWKNEKDRLPIIVKGARQVGKTESILRFADGNYQSVIYINFVEEPKYKAIIEEGYNVSSIIKLISLLNPFFSFLPGETIIFFDEVQEFPEITTSLKFFSLDGRFDVICSGSLLGIHYQRIQSISVGYKVDYEMRSIDFEEFLMAKGYDNALLDDILSSMQDIKPFGEPMMSRLNSLFLDYCLLGGMPFIVRNYLEKGSFETTLKLQQQIISDYKADVRKYAEGLDQTRIINVFNQIPSQLAKDNKKFQISKVSPGAKSKDYWGCIEWLNDAGLINICYCLNATELPLKGNCDYSKYKLYFADSGLLIASLDDEAQEDLRANKNLGIYKGALYENIIGEALVKSGNDLYYYKRNDSALEMDFFMRTASDLVPVEVKAGNNNAKSLRVMIESDKYPEIKWGIKLARQNIGYHNNIYTFPHFCAFLLKRYLREKRSPIEK
jgi:predicted AAA+ superfamily ATPase